METLAVCTKFNEGEATAAGLGQIIVRLGKKWDCHLLLFRDIN